MNIAINFSNPIGSFPYTENFQSGTFPPVNAYLINPDGDITWTTKSCTGRNGAATISMRIDNYTYNASGEEDVFGLVSMDLTNAVGAQLTFDLAHAPYSASYTDGLRVELSTDCGQTFTPIYNKSGTQLGTTANTTAVFTPSAAAQWRNEVVDLSTYVGNHVALRFIGVTDYGNDVFIDNINILRFSNPPTAAFTTANTTVCAGTPVTFTDLSTASPSSWSWNFGDGTAVSTQQNPSHTFANGGVYTIRLIANNPAGSDTSEQTAYLTVLEADFSSNASTSALDVDFTDLSFGANNWSWNFGDGASSTAQNPSHNYAAPGTYTVTLLINNNCSKIYQITVGSVAVSEIETNVFEAELMPNPAIEQTKLTLANALSEDLQVELLSVDGRIIRNLILPARLNSLTVDCSQLAPGLYFLRLKTEQLTESIKFVVKK
jgi:PKD repeat protein